MVSLRYSRDCIALTDMGVLRTVGPYSAAIVGFRV